MNRIQPMDFEVLPAAKKFLMSLRKEKGLQEKFRAAIENIRLNPVLGDPKKGDLSGVFSLDIRHNKTSYELAYCIEKLENGNLLLIIMAGTRENFYESLKVYIKSSSRVKDILKK